MPVPRRKQHLGYILKAFGVPVAIAIPLIAAAHCGGDFSDTSFPETGSLLAVFRDRVTKQFIGQSVGWADYILFAMAPLGVVIAIVGAIRVAHPPILRALIGRARGNSAAAEVDQVSPTLHEVCELWNGQMRVRTKRPPSFLELIFLPSHKGGAGCGQLTLGEPTECLGK